MTNKQFIERWLANPEPNRRNGSLSVGQEPHRLYSYPVPIATQTYCKGRPCLYLAKNGWSKTTSAHLNLVERLAIRQNIDSYRVHYSVRELSQIATKDAVNAAWDHIAIEAAELHLKATEIEQIRQIFINHPHIALNLEDASRAAHTALRELLFVPLADL